MFGRRPRGILDLARDQWKGKNKGSHRQKGVDLETLREKLKWLADWARGNLAEAQRYQKNTYDAIIQPREFQEGDKVLLLLPSGDTKLVAKLQGSYVVNRKVGPVDYEIKTPDKRAELKVYYVNMLKTWRDREVLVQVAEELGPYKGDTLNQQARYLKGRNLSDAQREAVKILQKEFPEVFSRKSDMTSLVQYKITIKDG